jgi:hypothetical protein
MTKKELTLKLLRDAGKEGVDNRTLVNEGVWRYSARIKELRDEGHNIRTIRLDRGHFRFVYEPSRSGLLGAVGKPQQDKEPSGGGTESPPGDPLFWVAPHEARAGERMYADPDTRD